MAINIKLHSDKNRQKIDRRRRRMGRTSGRIAVGDLPRLRVNRTNNHMMVQVMSPEGDKTFAEITTRGKAFAADSDFTKGRGRMESARKLGQAIAEKAIAAGIKKVAFDRAGYKYHGVVKSLADAAREAGLEF